jgi:hypothetical protein
MMIESKILIDYAGVAIFSGLAVMIWGFIVVAAYMLYKGLR